MFIHKLIRAGMSGEKMTIFGDGNQTRDFTYVDDAVDANLRAAASDIEGETFNIGTGGRVTINGLIDKVEEMTGESLAVERIPAQKGDVDSTCADITRARTVLGWKPGVSLDTGLRKEIRWMKNFRD
jgi:UDP-glucose 4-epimerase